MGQKAFWKSKRFWGTVASSVGFLAVVFGQYFGQDFAVAVQAIGTLLQAFGIPFTFYGGVKASQPLGMSNK